MAEEDLRRVPNRGTLRRLTSGMEITRLTSGMEITHAVKHEQIDFQKLSMSELKRLTDRRHGSKFLPWWNLERVVDWLEEQIQLQSWQFPPGANTRLRVRMDQPVGYVEGRLVNTIVVHVNGRWVHAYPDKDLP